MTQFFGFNSETSKLVFYLVYKMGFKRFFVFMSYSLGVPEMIGTGNSNRHVLYDEGAMETLLPSKP